uniref:Immunoglobulin domain-containing protein n=1 Tax=Cyprinus carpio TaxID=7962 RepID=A0A8C2DYA1_CYPCA
MEIQRNSRILNHLQKSFVLYSLLYENTQGIILLSLLLLGGVCNAETEEKMSVMEGDSVTLHTNLSEILDKDTILWGFGPRELIISQITRKDDLTSFFVTDEVSFAGRLQVDQQTGSLTIRNIRNRHSGQYKLTISREKTRYRIFHVHVFDVAGKTDGVKSVSVNEGESVVLQNDAAELQKDDLIIWRFGDEGILLAKIDVETNNHSLNDDDERFRNRLQLNQTGSLTITNARTEHAGLYEVQIRGRGSSKQFLVSVRVTVEEEKVSEMEGRTVALKTGTKLHDGDEIKWWFGDDNNPITKFSEWTITDADINCDVTDERFRNKVQMGGKSGDLIISYIRTIHSGVYKVQITGKTKKTKYKIFIVTVNVMKVPVKVGNPVTLETDITIEEGDLILWTFGVKNCLIFKNESGPTSICESFRGRLQLNKHNGSLTITNITDADFGHFQLQVLNGKRNRFRRFNVIKASKENKETESMERTPLRSQEGVDEEDEQQGTSSL